MLSSLPPTPTLTQRENSRQTNTVFDSFCLKPTRKKNNKRRRRKNCTVVRKTGCEALAHWGNKRHYSLPNKEKLRNWLCSPSRKDSFQLHRAHSTSIQRILFCNTDGRKYNKYNTRSFAYLNIILFFLAYCLNLPYLFVVLKAIFARSMCCRWRRGRQP